MKTSSRSRVFWAVIGCVALAGCSGAKPSSRVDYEAKTRLPPLEVPPPLKAPLPGPDNMLLPEYKEVLPQPKNVRMARFGDMRWLVVDEAPETLWPELAKFWQKQGLKIKAEERQAGIIETEWAENRADIPQSFIRELISKVAPKLYSSPTRDKYRTRVERGQIPGTSEIYIAHYGVEEVMKGDTHTVWQPRPSDPELVHEMLTRLMIHLGATAEEARAEGPAPAQMTRIEGETLVMEEGFARAWRRVGIALDRVGLVVEDLDRSQGLYYVRQGEEGEKMGWFKSLFAADQPGIRHLRLKVAGDESLSRVTVLDEEDRPLGGEPAVAVLTRLREQLH